MEKVMDNGLCRCCASVGTFKDVKSSYHWMGEEEVYADMLKDCLDITLAVTDEGEVGGICEVCITQLRNAANFKKQVLHTEDQFRKVTQEKLYKNNVVKVEVLPADSDNDSDNNLSDFDPDYELPIKTETIEDAKPKKRAAKATSSRAKKTKVDDGETSVKRRPSITRNITRTDVGKIKKEKAAKNTRSRELVKHHHNIVQILTHSNATPIRSHRFGYKCSYCLDQYPDAADLKKHTLENHDNFYSGHFFTSNRGISSFHLKMDITGLRCNICSSELDTLDQLVDHLRLQHDKHLYTDIDNHILPFKFTNGRLACFICCNEYNHFQKLLEHMNVHYRNYVCNVCNTGFVTSKQLEYHVKSHETGTFKCEHCPKSFDAHIKLKRHVYQMHINQTGRNRCGYCNAGFRDYRKKQSHVFEVHGIPPTKVECQACGREFEGTRQLTMHKRRYHLMEKNCVCPFCDAKFFNKQMLKDHMRKHDNKRDFQCAVCYKSFARRRVLVNHMHIHREDHRFKCEDCGKGFVYKCSLQAHKKSTRNPCPKIEYFDEEWLENCSE